MAEVVELNYKQYNDEGLPVIFLHGFPLDHSIWGPVIPLLKNHARLILPDLRGHGKSPVPEGPYTMSIMAADVLALMDKLEIDRAVLVGHSMGGYVCLAFAHEYPDRLSGLGLIATHARADTEQNMEDRKETIKDVKTNGSRVLARRMPAKLTPRPGVADFLREVIARTNPNGIVRALIGMAGRPDATGWLSSIDVPAVVIVGNMDNYVTTKMVREMSGKLKRSRYYEIERGNHMPMMETPQEVADPLLDLINALKKSG